MLKNMNSSVNSPCTGLCHFNVKAEICTGCFRTIDEIIAWQTYSNNEKLEVVNKAKHRKINLKGTGEVGDPNFN